MDLVTLATGIYGFTTAAKSMGWKKAASYFGQLALVELASDVSATTVATIGDYCDWPMGVTMLLSLGTGLTVGQVGNHLIFKRNGIEIFRKEVSESGEFLEDLMSPEDAARFRKFLEEGSTAGLTPEELAGIGKVDDYLALNRVDYDDVLALRRSAAESGSDVFEEIHWEDLMSPEDAARFRKFLEEGSTAGLTPEELAGLGKVDDLEDTLDGSGQLDDFIEGGSNTRLNTYGDALREKLGPAYLSHPEEYNAILNKAKEMGVSVEFREGTLAYDMEFGKPGKLIIDPEAYIGVLRHEYKHMLDDFSLGHPGMRIIADSDKFWELEFRGYLEELNLAREIKDYGAGEFIIGEMRQRKMEILGK